MIVHLATATVHYTPEGCVSHFADGASWGAIPHDTPHYHVIAHRCGYGDDLLAYCREHEVCHHLVSEWLLRRPSPVLWGLAHGRELTAAEAVFEEMAAQGLQRWVRANERPIIGGVDWNALKTQAVTLMGAR